MQAEHPVRAGGGGGDPGHRECGGAGGEHRAGRADPVQLGEELPLQLQLLGDLLDHQVRLGGRGQRVADGEPGEQPGPFLGGEPLAVHRVRGGLLDPGQGPGGGVLVGLDADHPAAAPGDRDGDAGAHRAESDHGDRGKGTLHLS